MKRTQLKDALRNIWKQKVSYLSVIVIAFLGVTTFLGIDYTDGALRLNGSNMYNEVHFRDLEIVSTLLMTQEDLAAIRDTEGVSDVEPVWQTSAKIADEEMRVDVAVISLTERINLPMLVEGRLPETAGECAVEQRLAEELGLQLGDTVETLTMKGETAQYLNDGRFTVVGLANHPDHTSVSIPDTLYVMVTQDAFDHSALEGCFMKAEVVVDKAADLDRFGKEYDTAVREVLPRLEALAESCTQRRTDEINGRIQARIDEGESELEQGEEKLLQAREELDTRWEEYEDGKKQLEEAERQLIEGKDKLDSTEDQLWAAKLRLDEAEDQLQQGRKLLDEGKQELDAQEAEIQEGFASIYGTLNGLEQNYDAAYAQVDALYNALNGAQSEEERARLEAELNAAQAVLADAEARRNAAYDEYRDDIEALQTKQEDFSYANELYQYAEQYYAQKLQEYETGRNQYEYALWQWYQARDQYREGQAETEAGRKQLEEAQTKLEQGEEEYAKGLEDYEDAWSQFTRARSSLEPVEQGRWLFFDCRGNSSFVQLMLGSSNLASLEMTFSMLFVVVGALVIYATISKMIDEQRSLVGAGKALGLYNREVFVKYLLFGITGTLLGTALGILAARFGMEVYVLKNASRYYTFDTTPATILPRPTILALAAGVLLSVAAVWFACTKLLRSTAIQLMQPKVPEGRKRAGKNGGHLLSLYSRLILLNIRTDIRRVIVTIVSVAGCCALVVIGFTLKSGVEGALENQYTKIVTYDGCIKFDAEAAPNASEELRQVLDEAGATYTELYDGVVTFRVKENLVGELLCGDLAELSGFYHLLDWKTGEPLPPTDEGILVQKRTAESHDLEVGSEMELSLGGTQSMTVRVAGIFDNYIGRVMLMSPAYYRQITGRDCPTNAFYLCFNGANEERLLASARRIEGYESFTRSDSEKSLFSSSSAMVTAVVALFIFMAAVMAGVVLMNLTNIYFLQKKQELTIMRINGFTVREVIGYMLRETVVTTLVGIVCGIGAGAGIAYSITRAMESAFVQYDRSLSYTAWAWGAVITAFFALLVNVLVLRKVKDLKLTDVQ